MTTLKTLASLLMSSAPKPYNPYSKFDVYALVETVEGELYYGVNVENATYTLTKHAEEVAVLGAIMDGAIDKLGRGFIETLIVATKGGASPCGICRQFVHEFANDRTQFVSYDLDTKKFTQMPFSKLLPKAFGPADLEEVT